MTKSFLFLVLILGLVLAQTNAVQAAPEKSPSSNEADSEANEEEASDSGESDDEFESDDEEYDTDPSPICLLFDRAGCQLQCMLIYQAYNLKASGTCDDNQICQCCTTTNENSLHNILETKFQGGDYVNRQLDSNHTINLQPVHKVFDLAPLRTADQFKQLLKPYLTPYQFLKLEPNDETMAAKFIEDQGKINTQAVSRYVTDKVARLVRSPCTKSLLTAPYKDHLRYALKEAQGEKGSLYNLTYRVRQLKNKSLEDVLKEYLKNNNLKEPKVDVKDDQDLNTVLANAVTNEIIALNDKKAKAQRPKKTTPPPKKPAAKATSKP